jgi:hypothetical protein
MAAISSSKDDTTDFYEHKLPFRPSVGNIGHWGSLKGAAHKQILFPNSKIGAFVSTDNWLGGSVAFYDA